MNEREKEKWYDLEYRKVKALEEINVAMEIIIRMLDKVKS